MIFGEINSGLERISVGCLTFWTGFGGIGFASVSTRIVFSGHSSTNTYSIVLTSLFTFDTDKPGYFLSAEFSFVGLDFFPKI